MNKAGSVMGGLAAIALILMSALITTAAATTTNLSIPPPPPINNTKPELVKADESPAPPIPPSENDTRPEPAKATQQKQAPPPPAPLAVLENKMLREHAKRELWHAYEEYNDTCRLLKYAASKEITSKTAQELMTYSVKFYNKALTLYNEKKFLESRAYAHLAIESLHCIKDIVTQKLAAKGYPPPPPQPPG